MGPGAAQTPPGPILLESLLRLKPALQAQSSYAILRNVLKEVLVSTVYAASVAMANGWRAGKGEAMRMVRQASLAELVE